MKKSLLSLLCLLTCLSLPALADHTPGHQGAEHAQQMEQFMKDGKLYTDRALDLMKSGHQTIAKAQQNKDAKLMLQGAEMLEMAYRMHKHSMHAMKAMHHELKHHLMHGLVGDMPMFTQQLDEIKTKMESLGQQIEAYHKAFHEQEARYPESGSALIALGNQLVQSHLNKDAEKTLQGARLLEKGMQLHSLVLHHGQPEGDHGKGMSHHGGSHGEGHKVEIRMEKVEIHKAK